MTTIARRSAFGLVLAPFGFSPAPLPEGPPPPAPGPRLRRGVNFHHVLNWPEMSKAGDYVWPPFASQPYQTSEDELRGLRAKGFDFIRLTVDPAIHMASEPARRADLLAILVERVRRLMRAGFAVVIDLHPVAQNPRFAPARLMTDGDAFNAYVTVTKSVAAALSRLDPTKVVLELFNEPPLWRPEDQIRWRTMQFRLHEAARATAGNALPLMLTGSDWGNYRALLELDTEQYKSSNVYYTFHFYEPHIFTHQGVRKEQERYIENLTWPADTEEGAVTTASAKALIAQDAQLSPAQKLDTSLVTERLLNAYFIGGGDRRNVESAFASVRNWARSRRISSSRIVMGEFGAVLKPTATAAVRASRTAWLRAVRTAAEESGFPWAYWAYKGFGGMTLLSEGSSSEMDAETLKALGLPN